MDIILGTATGGSAQHKPGTQRNHRNPLPKRSPLFNLAFQIAQFFLATRAGSFAFPMETTLTGYKGNFIFISNLAPDVF
jgi:hypothetical protein